MNAVAMIEPTQATSVVVIDGQCAAVEAWAASCDSVPELRDAGHRLAAIDEYLSRTSSEGRARVAAAQRRLEVRIGVVLGEAKHAVRGVARNVSTAPETLSKDERHEFRQMAAHNGVVEDVIASSTDDRPASQRKVMAAIKNVDPPKARRLPLVDTAQRAGWDFRKAVERIERIASDDRFAANKQQVAAHLNGHLSYAIEVCQDLLNTLEERK